MNTFCLICHTKIKTIPSRVKKGQDKYCSRVCYLTSRIGGIPWNKGKKIAFETCPDCGYVRYHQGKKGFQRCRACFDKSLLGIRPEKAIQSAIRSNMGNTYRKGKVFNEESRLKISESRKGQLMRDNNPNWKGGISKFRDLVRALPEYSEWRNKIYQRDNFHCVICEKGGYIEADHHPVMFATLLQQAISIFGKDIKKVRLFQPLWDINNGRTTCRQHNPRIYVGNKYGGGIYQ